MGAAGERTVSLVTLVDTGHTLTDPVSGRMVLVAEGGSWRTSFRPGAAPIPGPLTHPVGGMEKLSQGALGRRLRLLPYRAVGVECGFLPGGPG